MYIRVVQKNSNLSYTPGHLLIFLFQLIVVNFQNFNVLGRVDGSAERLTNFEKYVIKRGK